RNTARRSRGHRAPPLRIPLRPSARCGGEPSRRTRARRRVRPSVPCRALRRGGCSRGRARRTSPAGSRRDRCYYTNRPDPPVTTPARTPLPHLARFALHVGRRLADDHWFSLPPTPPFTTLPSLLPLATIPLPR